MAAPASRHDRALAPRPVPPSPARADFHSHTRRSDGLLEPTELVAAAAAAGVRQLAVTDHDTLAGVRELVRNGLGSAGLEVIPGVEMNAVVADRADLMESELHVLGLGVDPADDRFEAILARQRDGRRIRFERMVAGLRALGLAIDDVLDGAPPVDDAHALGRPTVARAMVRKGYVDTTSEAFDRYLSRGRPGYVPREGLGPVAVIAAIRDAGGIPVLAHFAEASERLDIVSELVEAGLAGLEVHYRSYTVDEVTSVGAVAASFGLLATGGTDFHGDRETYAQAHAALWLPDTVAEGARAALAEPR